jgi:hypothetical protein
VSIVDLLVNVEFEGSNAACAPRIDANQFFTAAKEYCELQTHQINVIASYCVQ